MTMEGGEVDTLPILRPVSRIGTMSLGKEALGGGGASMKSLLGKWVRSGAAMGRGVYRGTEGGGGKGRGWERGKAAVAEVGRAALVVVVAAAVVVFWTLEGYMEEVVDDRYGLVVKG